MQTFAAVSQERLNGNVSGAAKNKSFFSPVVQPKLTINQPNDPYEQEADAAADKVMRMEQPGIQLKPLPITSVQRKCEHCEEEEKKMQRKEMNGEETTADNNLESYVGNLNRGGQSLPDEVRNFYEPRFGYDFSNVKIHTNTIAAKSAQSINALAYTSGNNIVFNEGQYSPNTNKGKKLLGHELTHVVQQGNGIATKNIQRSWDWGRAGVGALIGGAAGALAGGLIGGPAGALIGAGAGIVAGGLTGGLTGASPAGTCTASATGVSLGASGSYKDGDEYGLITPINIRGSELADVQDSESVGASIDHTGSMTSRPSARSRNSDFQQADSIPDDHHGSSVSDHLSYFDNHGGDGSYSRLQMDLFMIPKCGINTAQAMPNSGYRIKREVKQVGTSVKGIITKTAEAVTVDGKSSTAGLTPERKAEVTLRP